MLNCSTTAVLIEPRALKTATVAMQSVERHTPNTTCFIWYHSVQNTQFVRALQIVQNLQRLGRVTLRIIPRRALDMASLYLGDERHVEQVMFMSMSFWNDMPTEVVLNFEADSILCTQLNPQSTLANFAQIGAPWPATKCVETRDLWKYMSEDYPSIFRCPWDGRVGNSGLSIRKRSWMLKAISACPSPYAGTEGSKRHTICRFRPENPWKQYTEEDVYFAAVLHALKAPLPSVHEASRFSWEFCDAILPAETPGGAKWSTSDLAFAPLKPVGFHGLDKANLKVSTRAGVECGARAKDFEGKCPGITQVFGKMDWCFTTGGQRSVITLNQVSQKYEKINVPPGWSVGSSRFNKRVWLEAAPV
mmetsp:Transcript_46626/g.77097  ORF Transcript_46626/g.77097 Transcript_46626/m.77097 type:complete len:362 (+) Transcript_46626:243-1328(+)|eukprot:CAMPEP_0119330068 /NCGR_PEP_ID=MMETSP1333-20130426/77424_1 /TAXON_ID=418940 /ORGANISM="Scyphosphaera apsteinii, Strain RCC1455" /LENGTH=361 /DNA_ID=CAMNT_0007339355 /DNA_START=136 /DNA_END=1221 /DNA_ORIENTATION=+